ncbi:hypothetical protein RQ832_14380, partial [Roseomonas sp. DSM 102946]|nr:hypothetical protein [Roseomonas sp. DSM 102946]
MGGFFKLPRFSSTVLSLRRDGENSFPRRGPGGRGAENRCSTGSAARDKRPAMPYMVFFVFLIFLTALASCVV